MSFFQGFTLDTLLGCISCILGVIALIFGTKAYRECKVVESSLNDHKEFNDSSSDHSQRAAGDIVNNNCDVEALTSITSANFETSLKQAYAYFEQQTKTNLQQIITEANRIVKESNKPLSDYTKIDWINIYFESAKNTSDEFMQNIWAKVLARELEFPGSFSYKTLDVLKNMSSDDFKSFEKLYSLAVEGWIFQEDIHSKYGLSYLELIRLSECGLLTMGLTQNKYAIPAHESVNLTYGTLLIHIVNPTDEEIRFQSSVFLLSFVANELLSVASYTENVEFAKDCVQALSKQNSNLKISLHRINYRTEKEVNYQLEDLCSK